MPACDQIAEAGTRLSSSGILWMKYQEAGHVSIGSWWHLVVYDIDVVGARPVAGRMNLVSQAGAGTLEYGFH